MTRRTAGLIFSGMLILFSSAATRADEFDVIKSYRFIPRVSRAEQFGGFAGRHETFTVRGRFDLNLGPEVSIPELEIHPSFENVRSGMFPHSPPAYVENTERIFNLSGLEGSYTGNNHIAFEGVNDQGAAVKLSATFAGRLVHLRGATHPPCCDFFEYSIDAYAVTSPFADFNFDGRIDASDYTTWRDHLGLVSGATLDQGDADGDGDVDQADFTVWKHDVGTVLDMTAFADADFDTAASLTAAPEPGMLFLLASATFGLGAITPRNRRLSARLPTA